MLKQRSGREVLKLSALLLKSTFYGQSFLENGKPTQAKYCTNYLSISWQILRFSFEAEMQKQVLIEIWQHLNEPLFIAFICCKLEGRWWLNLIWITSQTNDSALVFFSVQKQRSKMKYSSKLTSIESDTHLVATLRWRTSSAITWFYSFDFNAATLMHKSTQTRIISGKIFSDKITWNKRYPWSLEYDSICLKDVQQNSKSKKVFLAKFSIFWDFCNFKLLIKQSYFINGCFWYFCDSWYPLWAWEFSKKIRNPSWICWAWKSMY